MTKAMFIFDYGKLRALDPEAAAFLQEKETNVKRHIRRGLKEVIEAGHELIEAKKRYPDFFMSWSTGVFGVHYSTISNWVNTATSMSHAIEAAIAPPLAALYELAEPGVEQWRRDLAQRHIDAGTLDKPTAYIYARAPNWIVKKFDAGELPKSETHDFVVEFLKKTTPEDVRQYAVTWLVHTVDPLLYMTEIRNKYEKSKHYQQPARSWTDLITEGGTLNGIGWSQHISRATKNELERHRGDRQFMHIQDNAKPMPGGAEPVRYKWLQRRSCVVDKGGVQPGKLYIEVDEATARQLSPGEEIFFNLRVIDDEQT